MKHGGHRELPSDDSANDTSKNDGDILYDVTESPEEICAPTVPVIQSYAARWILKTRESRYLTRAATQGVIEDVQDLVAVVSDSLQSQTRATLHVSGIDPDSVPGLTDIFSAPTTKPFQGVTSFHQQLQ